jgi:hypothetical protein
MTITPFDIALPIGLALIFAVFRYSQYRATDPDNAVRRAVADGIKGAVGLAVITLGYKFIMPN